MLRSTVGDFCYICGTGSQSYKCSTIVIYDSRVVVNVKVIFRYDSMVVTYDRKVIIRLVGH